MKWLIVQSKSGIGIDAETIIKSDIEPDFWTCYNIANANGCEFFSVEAI